MFVVDLTVLAISGVVLLLYFYLVGVFYSHRHQLTPSSLLQANLAVSNLLTSYYLTGAAFVQAFQDSSDQHSTGWDMTLSSLSVTSWSLAIAFWYQPKETPKETPVPEPPSEAEAADKEAPKPEDVKIQVAVADNRTGSILSSYCLIAALWTYFSIMVLVHCLGLYGWTFSSTSGHSAGWLFFFLVPFLLPWVLQALLILPRLPPSFPDDVLSTASPVSLLSTLFCCSSTAALLAVLSTRILFPSLHLSCLLDEALLSVVCITWVNCAVFPLLLACGETAEVAATKREVDAVLITGLTHIWGSVGGAVGRVRGVVTARPVLDAERSAV